MDINPIEIQKFLHGISFPVTKEEIIKVAQDNDAEQKVFEVLEKLPAKNYSSVAEITQELGKII